MAQLCLYFLWVWILGNVKNFDFWKQGSGSVTIIVYRNVLFVSQDQVFDFRKEKLGCNYSFCKTWGSVSGVAEDAAVPHCYAMLSYQHFDDS
jgi:hypothetical protein